MGAMLFRLPRHRAQEHRAHGALLRAPRGTARSSGVRRQASNSLPGFISPFGSSTRLMPRITAISSALRVLSR